VQRARILISDDHPLIVDGLRRLLGDHFEVVGEVGNGIEFTGMPSDTKDRMQTFLNAIDPQMGISKPQED